MHKMLYFKLQIGCLVVIFFITASYIKEMRRDKFKCNRIFDALLVLAPLSVFFDGLTSWTVNHREIVSDALNKIAHLFFFITMDLVVIISSIYMIDKLFGFRNKKRILYVGIPGLVSLLLIILGINNLEYIQGSTTWYSMGFSVYVCYVTIFIYYSFILCFTISRRKFLLQDKVMRTLSFIIIAGVILLVQTVFPEALLTSLFPTTMLLGMYLSFEDPAILKVTHQKEEMLDGFATMVESRDNNTGGHIKRTRAYVSMMLKKMSEDRYYRRFLSKDYMTNVINAAPLHDIGKIATPDSILQKPGKLTDEEYAIMKKHAAEGADIIRQTFCDMDDPEFRQIAFEVARYHHEKYNGKGYPVGLSGEDIPLHARIMAIADVFDAVSQKRCYRDAMPVDKCFDIIKNGSSSDFDPRLVEIFLESREEVEQLMKEIEEEPEKVLEPSFVLFF